MIGRISAAIGVALVLASAAAAEPAISMGEWKPDSPIGKVKALAMKAATDMRGAGPIGAKPYVPALAGYLAAQEEIPIGRPAADTLLVQFDSPEEADAYIRWTQSPEGESQAPKRSMMVEDPYVLIAFELGTYYNEVKQPDKALQALDEGMRLLHLRHDLERSGYAPAVFSERGVALSEMKRWPEALANYDEGLTIQSLKPDNRARLYRGRGGALIELGRLDEAEQAFKTSLTYAPDHPVALGELKYITGLRAGAKPTDMLFAVPGFAKPNT